MSEATITYRKMFAMLMGYLKAILPFYYILSLLEPIVQGSENNIRIIGGELAEQGQFPYQVS